MNFSQFSDGVRRCHFAGNKETFRLFWRIDREGISISFWAFMMWWSRALKSSEFGGVVSGIHEVAQGPCTVVQVKPGGGAEPRMNVHGYCGGPDAVLQAVRILFLSCRVWKLTYGSLAQAELYLEAAAVLKDLNWKCLILCRKGTLTLYGIASSDYQLLGRKDWEFMSWGSEVDWID